MLYSSILLMFKHARKLGHIRWNLFQTPLLRQNSISHIFRIITHIYVMKHGSNHRDRFLYRLILIPFSPPRLHQIRTIIQFENIYCRFTFWTLRSVNYPCFNDMLFKANKPSWVFRCGIDQQRYLLRYISMWNVSFMFILQWKKILLERTIAFRAAQK